MSRDMRFPTMWYVQPAKAQTSLRTRQSDQSLCMSLENSMTVKLLTKHHFGVLSLIGGCTSRLNLYMTKCHGNDVTAISVIDMESCHNEQDFS